MKVYKLDDTLAVAAQIFPHELAAVAEAGYKVVVNNRPDGEEQGQPSAEEVAAAAKAAGLEYRHLPVTALDFPGSGFDEFSALLDNADEPVFAFCRTGTRCTNLWLATRDAAELDESVAVARGHGFDLSMAARYLNR